MGKMSRMHAFMVSLASGSRDADALMGGDVLCSLACLVAAGVFLAIAGYYLRREPVEDLRF